MDIDHDGELNYEEFTRAIVGEMNPRRKAAVQKAFAKMDINKKCIIEISDIKQLYNAKKHPDVLMGRREELEILYEFLDTFEAHYHARHPERKASKDREINMEEWEEYYNNISMSIDDDEYFEVMITNAYTVIQF
mgnify:CR=1 FL=1